MNTRLPLLCPIALILASLCALPAWSQQPGQRNPDETGRVYLGEGLTLISFKPRLLTANADVSSFLYSPTGDRIAYTTDHHSNNESDTSLAVVAVHSGETHVYVTGSLNMIDQASDMPPGTVQIGGLTGWSDDAHYLVFSAMHPASSPDSGGSTLINELEYVDLVRGDVSSIPYPPEALTPPAADSTGATAANAADTGQGEPGKLQFANMDQAVWAPGANLLAFVAVADFQGRGVIRSLCIYDPSRKTSRVLVSKAETIRLNGWLDNHRLIYWIGKEGSLYDLASGSSEVATNPASVVRRQSFMGQPLTYVPAESKQTIAVSADQQPVTAQTQVYGNATAIWIKRVAGPPQMNRLLVDVFRGQFAPGWTPDPNSNVQFAPNGGFDRQGNYQVAYLAAGDLKVCDLSVRSATLMERAIAGEKLPCDQERMLAMGNAKEIGLGILEYTQDEDENFPSSDNFTDGIKPYLGEDTPVDLPNIAQFHYLQPKNLSLGQNEDPAGTPLGTYDLPCATITVYMDGHVKGQDKPSAGGG